MSHFSAQVQNFTVAFSATQFFNHLFVEYSTPLPPKYEKGQQTDRT